MNLPLSKRLLACCAFIRPGDRVADIGCDHGYLSIHLLKEGIASYVIAADINEMPYQSAVRNAKKFGVQENISFHLSDGAKSIPKDFDTMVCAGMGADTMISFLEAAPWLRSSAYRLVLQCQSKTPMLRQYLSENGWSIARETVLRDGRFLYTVMDVCWDPNAPRLTVGQQYFSPALMNSAAPKLPEYYQNILFRLRRALDGQGEKADPILHAALEELEQYPILKHLKEEHHDNG